MPTFSCNHCGNRLEKKMPPFSCPSCKAKGKWFTQVEDAVPVEASPPAKPAATSRQPSGIGRQSSRPTLKGPTRPISPIAAPIPKPPEPQPVSERIIWSYPETATVDALPQRNGVAVDPTSGRIYACVQNNLIAIVETDDGFDVLWEYSTAGPIPSAPALGTDGNIRVHSADGYLHIVQDDGERHCDPVQMGDPLGWASPVVDQHNSTWISGYNGGLFKIDTDGNKATRPFLRSREKFDCTGLIHNDILYIGSNNACVHAIPLTETRGKNIWDPLADQGKTGWYINSAPVLGPGPMIIVASRDDHLYAFGLSGDPLWSEKMPGQILGSPVVHGDGIYLGIGIQSRGKDGKGLLARVDATTHRVIWRHNVDSPIESTPAISPDGTIYIGDNAGRIHAIDSSGKSLWKDHIGPPVRSVGASTPKGRILFGLDDGRLVAFN